MAERLDVLEARLKRLKDIRASGLSEASLQGRRVGYRSDADLKEAIADTQREIDIAKGIALRSRRRGTVCYPRLGF